jgi:K(+)-stimulated pyrophosphate-energized sodium pump
MNLVSVLIAPAVVGMSSIGQNTNTPLRLIIALVALVIIAAAVVVSKRRESVISDTPAEVTATA